jgi:hypothetical protein
MKTAERKRLLKFTLRRVYLNSGGYDKFGVYYGTGQPLYECESVDEMPVTLSNGRAGTEIVGFEFRADNREHARTKVIAWARLHHNVDATFYR